MGNPLQKVLSSAEEIRMRGLVDLSVMHDIQTALMTSLFDKLRSNRSFLLLETFWQTEGSV